MDVIRISAAVPHFGEEPVLSGTRGSGAIFFTRCNLLCVICQNWQISHVMAHRDFSVEKELTLSGLAEAMLGLQAQGCHNINLVSPSHVVRPVRAALVLARSGGLHIPVVYNSNGFDGLPQLRALENLVEIYLPDLKYADDKIAWELSGVRGYVPRARAAVVEMFRQVGPLQLDEQELALKGTMVRLLVLPGGLAGVAASLQFLRAAVGTEVTLSLMSQYNPAHIRRLSGTPGYGAVLARFPELGRPVTAAEYAQAVQTALDLGFENIMGQEVQASVEHGTPDFKAAEPFVWDAGDKLPVARRVC